MTDQNRKTLRSFYCRDYLWELFEQMTHDLGCSMDYLINESMRMYARSRDYVPAGDEGGGAGAGQFGGGPPAGGGFGNPPQGGGFGGQPQPRPGGGFGQPPQGGGLSVGQGFGGNSMDHRTFDRIPPVGGGQHPPRGMQPTGGGFGGGRPGGPPPPPPQPGGFGGGGGAGAGGGGGWSPQQPGGGGAGGFGGGGGYGSNGSPMGGAPPLGGGAQPPLVLIFNNNRYTIDKEKWVIGRGSQQTDLTIRDGNISRKHCAILYRNGAYYIKDLDSTNGVEYRGNRIESKKIEEGDVFYLCDYELRFTMRP